MPRPPITTPATTGLGICGSTGLLVTGYWLLGLWATAIALSTAGLYLVTPGSFDYVEGVALGHQLMSAGGAALYGTPIDQPPYSVPLYGPMFYRFYGLLLDTDAPSLLLARALNLLVTVYLCTLAVMVARQRLAISSGVACMAVLFWLILEPAAGFLLQNRPDTLALAFGTSGFVVAVSRRRFAPGLAILLLTAAAYTKQTAVVAPLLAALLVLLTKHRQRDAGILILGTAGLCLLILLLLNTLTGGGYWDAAVIANLNGFSPGSALVAWQKAGQQPLFWLALAVMLLNLRIADARRTFAIYGLISLALHGLAVAKPGANSNYFLEYSWCAALALGTLLDDLLRRRTAIRHRGPIIVLVLLTVIHSLALATQSLERLRETASNWSASSEWLSRWQTAAGGPVASMRPGVQLMQGYAPYILDPHIIARLTEQGLFDESQLIDDLHYGRIAAVIAADDMTAGPDEFSNWSYEVRTVVAEHYEKADSLGHLSVWLPQNGRSIHP